MSKHTPEPWASEGRMIRFDDGLGYGEMIANVPGGAKSGPFFVENDEECEANARRIVACVNACAGMSNDELEGGLLLGVMEKRIAELEQQRNNLTDTCARLIGTIAEIRSICDEAIDDKSNAAVVVVVLAKATKDILREIQEAKK